MKAGKSMKKWKLWVALLLLVLLLAGGSVAFFGYGLPYIQAGSTMPQADFTIEQLEDGLLFLTWQGTEKADRYRVQVLYPAASEEETETVFQEFETERTWCILQELPQGTELTIRIGTEVDYETLSEEKVRAGEEAREITGVFDLPEIRELQWSADPAAKTVSVSFGMTEGDICRVYTLDEEGVKHDLLELTEPSLELRFGDDGDLPVPGFGETCRLVLDARREGEGYVFYGNVSAELEVARDDLLDRNLNLRCTDEGNNVVTLTWDETKGEYYEVQFLEDSGWSTLLTVPGDGTRSYTTERLTAYRDYRYRVVAVGGQTMEDSEFAAVSEEIPVEPRECVVYATIWPTKALEAYSDPQKTEVVATAAVGTAYCVLEERDGMFAIGIDGTVCYVDSNYCMINLPEYLGDLCAYRITNSFSSMYMMHEFEIPDMTGVVTAGYEHVRLADGSYLVPLLYPTAQKLLAAGQSAREQGYRLKIYDSFRPNVATREMYSLAERSLNEPLPEKTYTGVSISSLKLPEGDFEDLTYGSVMLGQFSLNYYVAKGSSRHNLGIALDLTIESLETGEEIRMQTSMHDLSHYSALANNNSAANALSGIMKGAGFTGLASEWWHFQDNDARSALALEVVSQGVSAACWMADAEGWKYRTGDGTYLTNTTATFGEDTYTFDEYGYVVSQ